MRRISSVLLFSFVGVLSLAGQNLIKPKQIAPDTLNRIIIMTDTITEVDTVFREFKYYSIDSLVRQIVNDSLGIDSLWKKDGTYSLVQTYSPNNNFLFGTNVGNGLITSDYNVLFNNSLNEGTTYNFISGTGNFTNASDVDFSFASGISNNSLGISDVDYSFISGGSNAPNATTLYGTFINGLTNLSGATGLVSRSFVNGLSNLNTTATSNYNFASGSENGRDATSISASFFNGFRNAYLGSGTMDYSFFTGQENGYNAAGFSNSFVSGFRNLYNSVGTSAYAFAVGRENFNSATDVDYSFAFGFRNIYTGTGAHANVIAIGRENGYNAVSHSNSIYLGYRQGYTTGAANRLMIGMAQDDPLLSGHFTSDWIRVNGYFEVRDKTGTAGNVAAWDGDKLVDSGTSLASIGGDPDQTLSYNGATSDLTISGTGGNTIALPEMVAYPIGSTGYGYRPEISGALAGGEPLLITEGSGINIVDNGVGTGFSISATDASTTNELQTISKSGELVTLSDGGGSFSTHTIDLGTQIAIVQPGGTTSDVVVGDIDITVPGTSATSIIGRDVDGVITGVTLGSGLSLSSGTLSSTATSLWSTDGSNVFRSTGRVGVGGAEHPTYTFTANTGTIHTSGAIRGDDFYITGTLNDAGGSSGSSGNVLTSTGTATDWVPVAIDFEPALGAIRNSTTSTTSTSLVKMDFSTSDITAGGMTTSTINDRITVPQSGYYLISFDASFSSSSADEVDFAVYVSGSIKTPGWTFFQALPSAANSYTCSFSRPIYLTSGQYVEIYYETASGTTVTATNPYLSLSFLRN